MTITSIKRSYSELIKIPTLQERYEYLRLGGDVGNVTFGFDRYLNQIFYKSYDWIWVRNKILIRDGGWDLGVEGYPSGFRPVVHHMNPITLELVESGDPDLINPEYLILCSFDTHNAIHFGAVRQVKPDPIERTPWDTCPWRSM